jgi:CheY-like chemotaxis protein
MRVSVCANGREAVKLIRRCPFDLVLMDHMMPVMDGVAATRALRATDEERCRTLPVVALTAGDVVGMRGMFLENGFNDVLAKPIEMDKLDALLKRWLPPGKRRKAPPDDAFGNADGAEADAGAPLDADAGYCPPQASSDRSGRSGDALSRTAGRMHAQQREGADREGDGAPVCEQGEERMPCDAPPASTLPTIAGVDAALGIARVGGSHSLYLRLLAVFGADAEACLAHIAEEPDAASLLAFTTQVHAVKSALANIGADGLSKEAARLEKAGKEADMPCIRKMLPVFRERLAALTARVGAALTPKAPDMPDVPDAPGSTGPTGPTGDAQDLDPAVAELLETLRDALEDMDIDAADAALARLQALPLPAALRRAVDGTAERVLTADFHKAAETVAGLLGRSRP